jgi:hypothetical protein
MRTLCGCREVASRYRLCIAHPRPAISK